MPTRQKKFTDIFYAVVTNIIIYYINSTKRFIKNKYKLLKVILFSKNLVLFGKLFRYNNKLIPTQLHNFSRKFMFLYINLLR